MSNEVSKDLPKEVTPSRSLVMNLRQQLMQVIPFSEMKPEHVDFFIKSAKEHYFAPEEIILDPSYGEVKQLFFLQQIMKILYFLHQHQCISNFYLDLILVLCGLHK